MKYSLERCILSRRLYPTVPSGFGHSMSPQISASDWRQTQSNRIEQVQQAPMELKKEDRNPPKSQNQMSLFAEMVQRVMLRLCSAESYEFGSQGSTELCIVTASLCTTTAGASTPSSRRTRLPSIMSPKLNV